MPTSEAQKRATQKYISANLQELRFRVKIQDAEKIKAHAASKGLSLRAYLIHLIESDMGCSLSGK